MKNAFFIAAVIFALFFFYTHRYEIIPVPTPDSQAAYRLDRWTGTVTLLKDHIEYDTRKKE